jgi:hypothetical protein
VVPKAIPELMASLVSVAHKVSEGYQASEDPRVNKARLVPRVSLGLEPRVIRDEMAPTDRMAGMAGMALKGKWDRLVLLEPQVKFRCPTRSRM